MERIEQGGDTVLVSTLVFLEIIEVIRKRITERESYVGLNESAKQVIKSKIDAKTREFIDKMTKLATQGKVRLVDPDKPLKDYLENTLNAFLPHFGVVAQFDYCFTCQRNTPTRYRYQGLGHYDMQHAMNARECYANEIVSFDKGFFQLQNIREFDSLKVTVL